MTAYQLLASKLSNAEISELSLALSDERYARLKRQADTLPALNDIERVIAIDNKIRAIKYYKERTGVSLVEAKHMVDKYLEYCKYNKISTRLVKLTEIEMKLAWEGTGAGAVEAIMQRLALSRTDAVLIIDQFKQMRS